MLASFIQWTTELNQDNHWAFAAVTVLTMAAIGAGIAVVAEVLLSRLSPGKAGSAGHHHTPGH